MTDLSLQLEKTIHAPIDSVFDAWLDPLILARFMLPHRGSCLVVDRPRQLKFSWQSHYSPDDSVVTFDFAALDDQTTALTLTQVKFLHEEARDAHEGGWQNILDSLEGMYQAA